MKGEIPLQSVAAETLELIICVYVKIKLYFVRENITKIY